MEIKVKERVAKLGPYAWGHEGFTAYTVYGPAALVRDETGKLHITPVTIHVNPYPHIRG